MVEVPLVIVGIILLALAVMTVIASRQYDKLDDLKKTQHNTTARHYAESHRHLRNIAALLDGKSEFRAEALSLEQEDQVHLVEGWAKVGGISRDNQKQTVTFRFHFEDRDEETSTYSDLTLYQTVGYDYEYNLFSGKEFK